MDSRARFSGITINGAARVGKVQGHPSAAASEFQAKIIEWQILAANCTKKAFGGWAPPADPLEKL